MADQDYPEVTPEELDEASAEPLPERAAMSVVATSPTAYGATVAADGASDFDGGTPPENPGNNPEVGPGPEQG